MKNVPTRIRPDNHTVNQKEPQTGEQARTFSESGNRFSGQQGQTNRKNEAS